MSIKRFISKSSIVVPIIATCYLFWNPFSIYISEVNFDLWYRVLPYYFFAFTMIWLNLLPYQNGCKDGTVFEVLFNLLPVEVLLSLVFAQYHFLVMALLTLLIVVGSIYFRYSIYRDENKHKYSYKEHNRNRKICQRFFVMLTVAVLAVPSIISVFVYKLEDPNYVATAEILAELFPDEEAEITKESNQYENVGFIECFSPSMWSSFGQEEKVTVLQMLADYEALNLGMPNVPISSKRIDMFTLGEYSSTKNEICIDLEHLDDASPQSVMECLLHEVYHGFQQYVIQNIDWDSEFACSAYFAQAREWKDNNIRYINGLTDYEAYLEQPLEESARAFAETESSRLLALMISDNEPQQSK